jgi:hypothetical protein
MTRITWHTVLLGAPVWAVRRGHWQAAIVIGRGRAGCRVKFTDTGNCAQRRYEALAGRCPAKNGSDRPVKRKQSSKRPVPGWKMAEPRTLTPEGRQRQAEYLRNGRIKITQLERREAER